MEITLEASYHDNKRYVMILLGEKGGIGVCISGGLVVEMGIKPLSSMVDSL